MQVVCTHCAARYEFDAALIPSPGYDAQCTNCQKVFFVAAPSAAASTEPAPSELSTASVAEVPDSSEPTTVPLAVEAALAEVSTAGAEEQVQAVCSQCNAVYQFAASAVPASGYDAQCTRCQAVFFVKPAGVPVAVAPEVEILEDAEPVTLEPSGDFAVEPNLEIAPALSAPAATDDMLALNDTLGEPEADEELERALAKKRLVTRIGLAVASALVIFSGVYVLFLRGGAENEAATAAQNANPAAPVSVTAPAPAPTAEPAPAVAPSEPAPAAPSVQEAAPAPVAKAAPGKAAKGKKRKAKKRR